MVELEVTTHENEHGQEDIVAQASSFLMYKVGR